VCDYYSYRVVQFSYVIFFIEIPFKGGQSLSNSRSPAREVSYRLSGVIDTAQAPTLSNNFEVILENALTRESGAQMGLFDEKTRGQKSRDTVPLTSKRLGSNKFFLMVE
jgi:hypothetical protein